MPRQRYRVSVLPVGGGRQSRRRRIREWPGPASSGPSNDSRGSKPGFCRSTLSSRDETATTATPVRSTSSTTMSRKTPYSRINALRPPRRSIAAVRGSVPPRSRLPLRCGARASVLGCDRGEKVRVGEEAARARKMVAPVTSGAHVVGPHDGVRQGRFDDITSSRAITSPPNSVPKRPDLHEFAGGGELSS